MAKKTDETNISKDARNTPPGPAGDDDGKTRAEQGGESAPRMPHERDESSDSQQNQDGATPVGKQAFNDVERGIVDTDRAPVTDRVYNDKVRR